MAEGFLEKQCEIWVDWTIALEKGVFKSPSFFRETQERSPYISGEHWRRGRLRVPIINHFAVTSRALGLWSRRNRQCSFSGYMRLAINFVRQANFSPLE